MSSAAPFRPGELIRIDSEPMLVVSEGEYFGFHYLAVLRTHLTTHNIGAAIFVAD
jgi:hypothetical protein